MADQETGKIIYEDQGEDYEPPQEEIIAYAQYLGFDLPEDEDLLHIAKEGLKAPLPDPWKACQTKDGEIYYFNPNTQDSTWDHPLDDHYKNLYQTEKKKKEQKKNKKQKTEPLEVQNIEFSPEQKKKDDNDSKNFSNLLDKLSPIAGGSSNSQRNQKSEIKEIPQNKEVDDYKLKREEEFQQKKKELENLYQEKINKAQQENHIQLQNLIEETNTKLHIEKEKIKAERSARRHQADNKSLDEFKLKLFEELKEKKRLAIENAQRENEKKLTQLKERLNRAKQEKIDELRSQLESKREEEIGDLEKRLTSIQNEILTLNMSRNAAPKRNLKAEEEAFKAFLSQQEDQFYSDKLKMMKVYEEKCKEMKAVEYERYQRELDALPKLSELKDDKRMKVEEENFIRALEVENQNKLSLYQQELQKKKEAARSAISEKLNEIEKKKHDEVLAKLTNEYKLKVNEWQKEKASLEEKFNVEKNLLEANFASELQNYKSDALRRFDAEFKDLESKKAEKSKKLNQALQEITANTALTGKTTAKNHTEIQLEYQSKIKQLNELLLSKNMDVKNLTSKKFHLETELNSLNEKLNSLKKESDELALQTDCESLNNLFEHLTKKLAAKDAELKTLQEERKPGSQFSTVDHKALESINIDTSIQFGANDIEKIVKELESLKQELKNEKEHLETEPVQEAPKKTLNQNNSFSHLAGNERPSLPKKTQSKTEINGVERQIRNEIQNLLASKNKITKDLQDFNKEFATSENNTPEMKSYYSSLRSLMQEKIDKIDIKLQELQKYLGWAARIEGEKDRPDLDLALV